MYEFIHFRIKALERYLAISQEVLALRCYNNRATVGWSAGSCRHSSEASLVPLSNNEPVLKYFWTATNGLISSQQIIHLSPEHPTG